MFREDGQDNIVRPLAGAGIEIVLRPCLLSSSIVRPLAGAGLEIIAFQRPGFAPSRGRELKYLIPFVSEFSALFAPSRGRELK